MLKSAPGISIIIPAYNAAGTLPEVLERIPADLWPRIVTCRIINDGSHDSTAKVIFDLAQKRPQISGIHFRENRGYGSVVKYGLDLCRRDGCDVAACLHSDGQYPPEFLPQFADTMQREGYDILQGSRIASGTAISGGMPLYKYVAGKTLTFFENMVFGLKMTDYHSGFMVYSRRALEKIHFGVLSDSFDFDLEVIASARSRGMKVGELPIPTRYAGEKSYLNPIGYGFRVVGVMAGYVAGKYGRVE